MLTILEESNPDQHVLDMCDGEIAVITKWSSREDMLGRIVQRYKTDLITIGLPSGKGWSNIFSGVAKMLDCRVRVLESGTTFKLV